MKLNLKIDRKIVGISHKPVSDTRLSHTYDAEAYKKKLAERGQGDEQGVKNMADRVRVLEQELQTAREESFHAGFDEGKERGFAEASKASKNLQKQLEAMEQRFADSLLKMELPLLNLARKMAEKVLMKQLDAGIETDDIVLENIRKGLQEVIDEHKVLIRMNPEQLKTLNSGDIKQERNLQGNMDINLVGDKNLRRGESVLESENYIIDGTYSTQLDHLRDQIAKEVVE